ncbi:MAG: ABC transporter ATP-binding protein [Anaerolineae bacterium]|nr:ABC transporter ATP-binding protein [Anaerolineae bacterium]
MASFSNVLEIDGLTVSYRRGQKSLDAVRNVSFSIAAGQSYGLVGESGSGKSTLALAIMQYLPENGLVTGGTIRLGGQDLAALPREQMQQVWRDQVKLVPQDPASSLNPSLRIGDQLDEALRDGNEARDELRQRSLEQLRQVRIADPERVTASYPHQLSGGMQQRVLIAMALARQPSLLILDEPTTNLDVTTEAVILDLVRDLVHGQRTAILYVSHNLGVVASICDRVAVLYAGELVEDLAPQQLRRRPLHPYTLGLLDSVPRLGQRAGVDPLLPIAGTIARLDALPAGCVFAPRCPIAQQLCRDVRPELEETPEGGLVRCHRWREIAAGMVDARADRPAAVASQNGVSGAASALRTEALVKHFPVRRTLAEALRRTPARQVHAVDGVSLQIGQQRTLGLVGESGSGKTTAARCIVGLVERTGGQVTLFDIALAPGLDQREAAVLRRLQMVFQNPEEALNPHRTVGDVLQRPLMRLMGLSAGEARQQAGELLEAVRLSSAYLDRTPGQLSGGEKQRVAIARAFASNPDVLILDESVSALDVSVQASILNLLTELQAEQGSAYLFISHDLAAVSYLADDIAVMYLGQVVETGSAEQMLHPPFHPYTEALLSAVPRIDAAGPERIRLPGDLPSAIDLPSGCRFHTRCPRLLGDICRTQEPPWQETAPGHRYRCHIAPDELTAMQVSSGEQNGWPRREMGEASR